MPKTPEEIIAEFEERFKDNHVADEYFVCPAVWVHEDLKNPCDCVIKEIKSFLTESLAAYRLSVLSECEGLVEEFEKFKEYIRRNYDIGWMTGDERRFYEYLEEMVITKTFAAGVKAGLMEAREMMPDTNCPESCTNDSLSHDGARMGKEHYQFEFLARIDKKINSLK